MTEQAKLRDARRSYQFWIDDAIIDHFGHQLGPYGLAVYMALARRAKQGRAFPSIKRLALDTGMARASATRALAALEREGVISRERRRNDDGDLDTSLYTLNDLSPYHDTPAPARSDGVPPESQGRLSGSLPVGSVRAYGRLSESHEGSSLKDPLVEGSPPSVSPPQGEDTHTEEEGLARQGDADTTPAAGAAGALPELLEDSVFAPPVSTAPALPTVADEGPPPGRRKPRQPFPADQRGEGLLHLAVVTSALKAWAHERVPGLDVEREFDRWVEHGRAGARTYADFPAAFRAWLLHPLTRQQSTGPQSTLEARSHEARAAAQRFIREDDDGSIRQTIVFNHPTNGLGDVWRPLERHAPAGVLVGAQGCVHA